MLVLLQESRWMSCVFTGHVFCAVSGPAALCLQAAAQRSHFCVCLCVHSAFGSIRHCSIALCKYINDVLVWVICPELLCGTILLNSQQPGRFCIPCLPSASAAFAPALGSSPAWFVPALEWNVWCSAALSTLDVLCSAQPQGLAEGVDSRCAISLNFSLTCCSCVCLYPLLSSLNLVVFFISVSYLSSLCAEQPWYNISSQVAWSYLGR